jgi:hypothetical protein
MSETDTTSPPQPAPRRTSRGLVAAGVVFALVGAGIGVWAVTGSAGGHQHKLNDAKPPAATPAGRSGIRSDGTHYGPLTDFLIPAPAGFESGPDVGPAPAFGLVPPSEAAAVEQVAVFDSFPTSSTAAGYQTMFFGSGVVSQLGVESLVAQPLGNSTGQTITVVLKQSPNATGGPQVGLTRSYISSLTGNPATGIQLTPPVPGHPEAFCATENPAPSPPNAPPSVGFGVCVANEHDVTAVMNVAQDGIVGANPLTSLFGQQLDRLTRGASS